VEEISKRSGDALLQKNCTGRRGPANRWPLITGWDGERIGINDRERVYGEKRTSLDSRVEGWRGTEPLFLKTASWNRTLKGGGCHIKLLGPRK